MRELLSSDIAVVLVKPRQVVSSAKKFRANLSEVAQRYLAVAVHALRAGFVVLGAVEDDLRVVGVHLQGAKRGGTRRSKAAS